MKIKKAVKVRYSPLFEEQLKKLREIIKEKDSKFHKQLLKAIEREKEDEDYLMNQLPAGAKSTDDFLRGYSQKHGF